MTTGSRRVVSAAFILIASAGIWYALSIGGNVRGSLTDEGDVHMRVKEFADTDHDRILSAREIRKALSAIIRGVIGRNGTYDITRDGVVDRGDTREALRVFRLLLVAACGNGTIDAGESCDDSDTVNGDGCDATCTVESGYSCSGQPSTCTQSGAPPVCGNGTVEAGEQCDDGNLVSGDGCSGTDHPNGPCTWEFCGDGYVDHDGLTNVDQSSQYYLSQLINTSEQCDNGGVCVGGPNNGQPCHRFAIDEVACGADVMCITVNSGSCTSDCQLP